MGETVTFPSNGDSSTGYLAFPSREAREGGQPVPGVIVIQEWWGLVPHIQAVTDRFAAAGFVAFAPDLYRGVTASEPAEAGKLLMGLAMDQAARDIAGAAEYLAALPDCSGAVGTMGFCMGGSLALWSATLSDRITATCGFYPALPWERMAPKWSNYRGKRAMIHCSEADGTSAAPGVVRARDAIVEAGGDCTLYDYRGTQHAFFNDDRPEVYDSAASALAWAHTLQLFRTTLS